MGAFTVALSAWAVASATSASRDETPLEPKAAPVATVESESVNAPMKAKTAGGFRLEGAPELEILFGDADRYKRHVDSFFGLGDKMTETRHRFSRHVKASLAMVATANRGCPHEALGPHYYAAHLEGENYRALGSGFEREYSAIRRLHRHGDTAALTPDYRWRVNRTRSLYARSLTDYKEMRFSFLNQLGDEIAARGCSRTRLLEIGKSAPRAPAVAVEAPVNGVAASIPRKKKGETDARALPATFFVDNRECGETMAVYVDGTLVGEVEGAARTAFQTTIGGHTLCLIADSTAKQCGEPGTVRSAYFHDGWSVNLHCKN